jgi:cytochrome b subunit of formate dehydrogenase
MNSPNINQPFLTWIKAKLHSLKGIAFLTVSVISIGYNLFLSLNLDKVPRERHLLILYGTQSLMILIISAIIAFGKPPDFHKKHKRGSCVVEQFWKWWSRLWLSWLLLYVGLTIWDIYRANKPTEAQNIEYLVSFGLHQLNNLSTLIILMLYHILAQPSLSEREYPAEDNVLPEQKVSEGVPKPDRQKIDNESAKFIFWIAIFVVAAIAEVGLVLSSADPKSLSRVFGISYGILAATATALMVGRLDSNLLGMPTLVIAFLFLYAGIQPSFDFVLESGGIPLMDSTREVIVVIALLSKIVLFAVIQWLSKTDRLLFYMVECYRLLKRVDSDRKDFLTKL